ncbi:MAG: universal stress protein [Rubrivivax sp.]|nr:universal stress protein [Rubrivivax sp.]
MTADVEVRCGHVSDELHRALADADMLAMGQRRRSALAEIVLDRTVQRLEKCSRRPVLVVKQVADGAYRRALVPIDFTPASEAAALVAAALAPDIDLEVFQALDSTDESVMRDVDVSESVIRAYRVRQEAVLLARMRRRMARLGLDARKLSFALWRGWPASATREPVMHLQRKVLRGCDRSCRQKYYSPTSTSDLTAPADEGRRDTLGRTPDQIDRSEHEKQLPQSMGRGDHRADGDRSAVHQRGGQVHRPRAPAGPAGRGRVPSAPERRAIESAGVPRQATAQCSEQAHPSMNNTRACQAQAGRPGRQ